MNKKKLQLGLIFAVLFVTYNIVLFLVSKQFSAGFWISYGFIVAGFGFALGAYLFVSDAKRRKQVVGMPVTVLSTLYFCIEIVLGTVLMFFPRISFAGAFIPQFVIFALFLLCFIGAMFSDNNYKDQ